MCLAIPGKVLEIDRSSIPLMADVSFSGIRKRVCVEWIPEVQVGEYVIVHVGFAISKMNEQEAQETLRVLREAGQLWDELENRDDSAAPAQNPGRRTDA